VSYRIELRRAAQRQLDKLVGRDYQAVATVISTLEHEPRPSRVEKLAESGLWRIRVGSYRIIYSIDDKERLVIVVRIARRTEDTYKRL
jgi:mRNA interferase RelE/StbE